MQQQEWWQVVQSIAGMVQREGVTLEEDGHLKELLSEKGFSAEGICAALEWLERASLSGNVMDALSMLVADPESIRVQHPAERAYVHPRIWREIERARRLGILGFEAAERLIDGFRQVDSRDWEAADIAGVLQEILRVSGNSTGTAAALVLRSGEERDQYH